MENWTKIGIPRARVRELERGRHYTFSIRYKDHTNKWKYTKFYNFYGSKTDLRNEIYKRLHNVDCQQESINQEITFKELAKEFVERREKLNVVQAETVEREKYLIKKLNTVLANYRVAQLNKKDIQEALIKLKKNGESDYSLYRTFEKLKQILETAIDDEIILRNPCRNIKIRKNNELQINKKKDYFMVDKIKMLEIILEKEPKTATYVAMYIALMTGMRRGEILALLWKDINLESGTINIYKQLTSNKKIKKTKTVKSTRIIIMPKKLSKYLNDWKNIQQSWAKLQNRSFNDKIPVICNESLKYISPDNMRRTWKRFYIRNNFGYIDKTGKYNGMHFHNLRDAHATLLFNCGAREKEVQERLGHSRINTTMDIYTSLFKETKNTTANIVDKFFD